MTSTPPSTQLVFSPEFVVSITGAGRGIGRATALAYAKAGASGTVICSRRLAELDEVVSEVEDISKQRENEDENNRSNSIKVLRIICDVKDKERVKAAVEETRITFGRLDVLTNNARRVHD